MTNECVAMGTEMARESRSETEKKSDVGDIINAECTQACRKDGGNIAWDVPIGSLLRITFQPKLRSAEARRRASNSSNTQFWAPLMS